MYSTLNSLKQHLFFEWRILTMIDICQNSKTNCNENNKSKKIMINRNYFILNYITIDYVQLIIIFDGWFWIINEPFLTWFVFQKKTALLISIIFISIEKKRKFNRSDKFISIIETKINYEHSFFSLPIRKSHYWLCVISFRRWLDFLSVCR
jgi:hypothetical protein